MTQHHKYEIVQAVKVVLVRHGVDLCQLDYSCTKHTVYLRGHLFKEPRRDFTESEVRAMVEEIDRLPYSLSVQSDIENWQVAYDFGSWHIAKKSVSTKTTEAWGDINVDE